MYIRHIQNNNTLTKVHYNELNAIIHKERPENEINQYNVKEV